MAKKKKPAAKIEVEKKPEEDCSTHQKAKKIKISYQQQPEKNEDREIHPRKLLPPLEEGKTVPDKTPTPPIKIDK
jgi:hypothetical protein